MSQEIKDRIGHWQSTLLGVACIAAVCWFAFIRPELLDGDLKIILLAGGLFGVAFKGAKRG